MGILPMSLTGVPPVQMPKNMGKMPMRLMGETPMLRRMAFFNGLLTQQTDFQAARKYWNKLKERLRKEGSQSVTNCHRLKLPAADETKGLHVCKGT
jgi:hypothetical protein